jgi:hypothetical protein
VDRNAEARIQRAILEWCWLVAPDLIIYHTPNGGVRSKVEAARLRWQGVLPGIPDLTLVGQDGQLRYIEVKAGGSLSPEQRAFQDRCIAMRIPFAVARSVDDVRRAFSAWGIETREGRHGS